MRDQEDGGAPAHHARRPMNAFLIFCKRHRSVVREKYPNLENRSITKILGEWWANLEKEDKACYTGLAKQYKDAFFNANPDFKWYKLPAPPLRAARRDPPDHDPAEPDPPGDPHSDPTGDPTGDSPGTLRPLETTNNNSTKLDFNKNLNDHLYDAERPLTMITPGKLADEAQMGNLSTLLATETDANKSDSQLSLPLQFHTYANTTDVHMRLAKNPIRPNDNIRELQNALSETTRMFEGLDEGGRAKQLPTPNEKITNQDVIDQIVDNRFSKDEDNGYHKQWSDDEKNPKSIRSCKGKKYQEFMAVGGFIVNKRQKREHPDKMDEEEYNASCSWEEATPRARSPPQRAPHEPAAGAGAVAHPAPGAADADANISKAFKASDFDLDAKINALPSLSLEKFQQKKRDNKRKKKTINFKPKMEEPRYISYARDAVIGSQKRKPRKISITRLEINSLISAVELSEGGAMAGAGSNEGAGPGGQDAGAGAGGQGAGAGAGYGAGAADLLALATLAEVASNTSKLDGAAII